AGGRVDLARVVQLHHLDGVEEPHGLPGELHHEYGADAEVRCHQHVPGCVVEPPAQGREAGVVEAAGAHDRGDPRVQQVAKVAEHRAGVGEVDDDLRARL